MALVKRKFSVRDTTSTPSGKRVTGLAPACVLCVSDSTNAALPALAWPTVAEVGGAGLGNGQYTYSYDPEGQYGAVTLQFDATPTGTLPGGGTLTDADRYIDDAVVVADSRTAVALPAVGAGLAGGLPTVNAANQVQTDPSFVVDSAGGTTVTFAKWLQIVLSLLTQKYIVQLNYPVAGQQTATYYRLDGVTSTISTTVTFDAQGHPLSRGVPTIT